MADSGNPAAGRGVVPDTAARTNSPGTGNPNGMGTEGGSQGVITALSIETESLPPNTRTVQEPDGEWLK
jgi:hypothetical protein